MFFTMFNNSAPGVKLLVLAMFKYFTPGVKLLVLAMFKYFTPGAELFFALFLGLAYYDERGLKGLKGA